MSINYGIDLKLTSDGDLSITNSDMDVVKYQDNIQQSLTNLLSTDKGSFPLNKNYGIDFSKFIGAKGLKRTLIALTDEIYTALRSEPRIKNIFSINVTPRSGVSGVYDVNVVLGLIGSNDQVSLNLVYPNQNSVVPTIMKVDNEFQYTISKIKVRTQYDIHEVIGVYSVQDSEKAKNLYNGGTFEGKEIILGTQLQLENSKVVIDYVTKNVEYQSIKTKFIDYEYVLPIDNNNIFVRYDIYDLHGVYRHDDTLLEDNLYTDGSYYKGKAIFLATPIENINKNLLVVYTAYVHKDQLVGYNF